MHGHVAASGQIARHADNVELVRVRFAAVKDASAGIAGAESTYGLLCRWITEDFRARHRRQDELFAYVEENLRLIGESLRTIAGVVPAFDPTRLTACPSMIAPVAGQAGARVGWTVEDLEPLRDVLDRLTGTPEVIASHAVTWRNMAGELWSMADELEDFVAYDIPGWHGAEADEHRRLMGHNVDAIRGLSSVSEVLAEITESVAVLVAQTRRITRDLVIDLLALAVPTAKAHGTFARWACRVTAYAVALDATVTHLDKRLNG